MSLLVVAHRGDSDRYPENTLASFQAALEVGASYVELDVQLTRDGELVVIHDATLDRTTDGHGPVGDQALDDLRQLSAGYPERFGDVFADQRILTISEALGLLRDRAQVLVEIKPESVTGGEDGVEARTVAAVEAAGMADQVAIASFHLGALARCQALAPEIRRAPLFKSGTPESVVADSRRLGAMLALPHKTLLSEELRDRARAEGLPLAAWIIDDPAELAGLARYQLHGIGTNRPGAMLEALGDR